MVKALKHRGPGQSSPGLSMRDPQPHVPPHPRSAHGPAPNPWGCRLPQGCPPHSRTVTFLTQDEKEATHPVAAHRARDQVHWTRHNDLGPDSGFLDKTAKAQ